MCFDPRESFVPEGDPYQFGWYGLVPPDVQPLDWLPVRVARFAWREFAWEPGLSQREFRRRLRGKFLDDTVTTQVLDDLLWLCAYHRKQHWVFPTNAYKDAFWCRSRGHWHFYFGHLESAARYGSPIRPPRQRPRCSHPVELYREWKAAAAIPEDWLGFFYRLKQHRRITPMLLRMETRLRQHRRRARGLGREGIAEMLRVIHLIKRNVLFLPTARQRAAAERLDRWVEHSLGKIPSKQRRFATAPYTWGGVELFKD
jgi:hypothetical protein